MITPEERQEIIHAACEKALLMLPEIVGNLMVQHASLLEINKTFYGEHPEFVAHKPIVQSVIEQLEGARPTADYKDLLRDAVPIIRERLATISKLDMTTVQRPNRHLPHVSAPVVVDKSNPHGEL
jgi:hypothetical protein